MKTTKWISALVLVIACASLGGYAISAYSAHRARQEWSKEYDARIISKTSKELQQNLKDIHETLSAPTPTE